MLPSEWLYTKEGIIEQIVKQLMKHDEQLSDTIYLISMLYKTPAFKNLSIEHLFAEKQPLQYKALVNVYNEFEED